MSRTPSGDPIGAAGPLAGPRGYVLMISEVKMPSNKKKPPVAPRRSFADEFPVDEAHPPVTPLKVKNRPGRLKVKLGKLGKG